MFGSYSYLRPSTIGIFITGILVIIALVIFRQQSDFNPAVKALSERIVLPKAATEESADSGELASGTNSSLTEKLKPFIRTSSYLVPLSPPEEFSSETLSDKIDGKAELYLPAGFRKLECQRFRASYSLSGRSSGNHDSVAVSSTASTEGGQPGTDSAAVDSLEAPSDLWIEIFVYDMTLHENAFSVFSRQRRDNSTPLSIAEYAYSTENAIFLVHGHFYIEMVASLPSVDAVKWMAETGTAFIDDRPAELSPRKIDVPELFPAEGLDKESITLIASDAFGFDRFNNIYTAGYSVNGKKITLFISKRSSSEEALQLAQDYFKFLSDFGGNRIDSGINGVYGIEIMDTIELVFSSGQYVAGVRDSDTPEIASNLAHHIQARLAGVVTSSVKKQTGTQDEHKN